LWTSGGREAVLFEYFSDTVFPRIQKMGYAAVRTRRWKYIRYAELTGADELYDLREDPFELNNLVDDRHAPLGRLKEMLAGLLRSTGAAVTGSARKSTPPRV